MKRQLLLLYNMVNILHIYVLLIFLSFSSSWCIVDFYPNFQVLIDEFYEICYVNHLLTIMNISSFRKF